MPESAGGAGARVPPQSVLEPSRFLNRELSWLGFNRRVLSLAEDPARPLLERVRFLAISAHNLDEFFQVRIAGLAAQLDSGVNVASPDGLVAGEQLRRIRPEVEELVARQDELLTKSLVPELAAAGIELCAFEDLRDDELTHASSLFDEKIFPVLTPLSVDPAHPFPYISSLSLSLAIVVTDPGTGEHRFARVKVPPIFPRWLAVSPGRYVPVEQVIAAHLPVLFPGMEVVSCAPFRVTRDAELAIAEGEADDLLAAIESGLKRRRRMSAPVRLEVSASMSAQLRDLLAAELELERDVVYAVRGPLDLSALAELAALDRPDLRQEPAPAWTQPQLAAGPKGTASDFFEVLKRGDVLVHHPYDSFQTSVEAFLAQAAADPDVLAIKHTLYRTSGPSNPVALTLIRAAEAGKQVVTLVELQGALRRRGEHRVGAHARAGGRPRRLRPGGAQGAREGRARGASRGRGDPALLPHRDGQLQPGDRHQLRGRGPALGVARARRRPDRALQLPDRLRPPAAATASCWSRPPACARRCSPRSARRRRRPTVASCSRSMPWRTRS